MASPDVVLRIHVDTTPFQRSMHDAAHGLARLGAAMNGQPAPPRKPYPRSCSRLTARQYRAARRAYARALTAWKRATR